MTTFTLIEDGARRMVHICGHAGYAKENDIVCAAASALGCALLQCLVEIQARGQAEAFCFAMESGSLQADITPRPQAREKVEGMLRMTETGFAMLEEAYPRHARVSRGNI